MSVNEDSLRGTDVVKRRSLFFGALSLQKLPLVYNKMCFYICYGGGLYETKCERHSV